MQCIPNVQLWTIRHLQEQLLNYKVSCLVVLEYNNLVIHGTVFLLFLSKYAVLSFELETDFTSHI